MNKSIARILLVSIALLTGCIPPPNTTLHKDNESRPINRFNQVATEFIFSEEITVNLGGKGASKAVWGDTTYRILQGAYTPHGYDDQGVYLIHEKGIIRSGNMGMKDRGGIFIPFEPSKPLGIWMVPHGQSTAIGVLGPLGAAVRMDDPKVTALYLSPIPDELVSAEKKELLRKQIEEANLIESEIE